MKVADVALGQQQPAHRLPAAQVGINGYKVVEPQVEAAHVELAVLQVALGRRRHPNHLLEMPLQLLVR